ncbi:MAG TPA: tyrosine--tRNA ligase [Vicinamibacterales bacterium]|jgi:tyrosyl-tRNA synthetase
MSLDIYQELDWRGLVYGGTDGVREALAREPVTAYIGFDPTASSLHVGSLLPVMALARLQRFGHRPIAIVGGGTGMIGDPSGKTQERLLLGRDQIEENLQGIRGQLSRFLDFESTAAPARIVNNAEWLASLDLMTFLRDVGKHFTVNAMLAKESVKRRVQQEEGISFTEFSYLLLQAYDFLMLFDRCGCTLQMGGSDQWGNITAGCELVRKLRGARVHGLVMPLVTTASGVKFGKTEAGAVWLDEGRTSTQDFYQFWLRTDDQDVVRYLKSFTFLSRDRISELAEATERAPEAREAQRALAREVTALVHGEDKAIAAEGAAARLYSKHAGETLEERTARLTAVPATVVPRAGLMELRLPKLLVELGLAPSANQASTLIKGGGFRVNNKPETDINRRLSVEDAPDGLFIELSRGKEKRVLKLG